MTRAQQDNVSETGSRAVLYLRVASADPRDQRLGIERQRDACRREAERLDAGIAGEYVDGELLESVR